MCIIPSPPLLFSLFSSSSLCVSHLILLCTDGWACAALRIPLLADSLSAEERRKKKIPPGCERERARAYSAAGDLVGQTDFVTGLMIPAVYIPSA